MITHLYRSIEKIIAGMTTIPDLSLYSYNRDESKFWQVGADSAGNRTVKFTGFQNPNLLPHVGYSVLRERVMTQNGKRVAKYDLSFRYMDAYDFDKNNFDLLQQRAEWVLFYIHHSLISNCYNYSSGETMLQYEEGKAPQLVAGAYMFATYESQLNFDPCCFQPHLI